ncbi:hypothetical protein H5410_051781 [Solanum commersonii]|uniref:Uncharacterized protein n=1 Tax=Solanum commersonii TaxID=4109 RepID=A0A9J5WZG8_SOLCO|nr:hypothetical protein H5410_051781 [Solanum commersonii]
MANRANEKYQQIYLLPANRELYKLRETNNLKANFNKERVFFDALFQTTKDLIHRRKKDLSTVIYSDHGSLINGSQMYSNSFSTVTTYFLLRVLPIHKAGLLEHHLRYHHLFHFSLKCLIFHSE